MRAKIIDTHYEAGQAKYLAGHTYDADDTIRVMVARGHAVQVSDDEPLTEPAAPAPAEVELFTAAPAAEAAPEPAADAAQPEDSEPEGDDPPAAVGELQPPRRGRLRKAVAA